MTTPSFRPRLFPTPPSALVPIVLALAVAFSALAVSGCASKPTMKLNHAEISGVHLGFPPTVGVVMTMVLDVYNPNSYDVAVRAMRGTATLAGRYTLPIDWRPGGEGAWMAANTMTSVRVPVTVPVDLALQLLRESYTTPTVSFRVVGTADVTATRTFKIEKDNYSVDEVGTFSRQQLEMAIPHF
ncbi:MAG: hypothetical protein JWP87_814 [Labilithrix sp.]|nr:hypothetical protein [Labilithrix sp.]